MLRNPAPRWLASGDKKNYANWRARKLALYPVTLDQLYVDVVDADMPTDQEIRHMRGLLGRYNMVLYRTPDMDESREIPLQLCKRFGLRTLDTNLGAGADAVTEIRVKDSGIHGRYIPYTSSQLSWHTDGYYNSLDRQIRAMALHCVRPAKTGGENELLDIEMAYIYLRDLNPDFIAALSEPDVMTIPANVVDGKTLRTARSGPVFSVDARGSLHMRYTARKRNILWKNTPLVEAAVDALEALFNEKETWILQGALSAGEGLICNNVLHNRRAFEDDPQNPRLLYRLRYYERAQ